MPLKTDLTLKSYQAYLKAQGDRPVVVRFTADWCKPCQKMKPEMARIQQAHPDLPWVELTEANPQHVQIADELFCDVQGARMPALAIYRAGTQVAYIGGAMVEAIEKAVCEAVAE